MPTNRYRGLGVAVAIVLLAAFTGVLINGKRLLDLLRIGTFRSDAGTIFGPVPRTSWEPLVRDEIDEASRLLQALNLLVITTPERRILLEAGLLPAGERVSDASIDALSAREGLSAAGLDPASVELVVPSHLHRDHAGGLATGDGAALPRAQWPRSRQTRTRRRCGRGPATARWAPRSCRRVRP